MVALVVVAWVAVFIRDSVPSAYKVRKSNAAQDSRAGEIPKTIREATKVAMACKGNSVRANNNR
jgi:hypothetical protein